MRTTLLAIAVVAVVVLTVPAQAGEFYFGYRSGNGGCYLPPPPVRVHTPPPGWGGPQPYYQPQYYPQPYYGGPQQCGPSYAEQFGWGAPPPDRYSETTTCQRGQCWQDSSATWRTPGGGRFRVQQSGPVPPPWRGGGQIYHW